MSSIAELCLKHFESDDLYVVLGIAKDCEDAAIKKAYYKQSLKVHPDRAADDEKETATEKFQTLGKVYSILGDSEKRKIYDETGSVDDDSFTSGVTNWDEYWRLLFKKISKNDIIDFEKKYKGSEEEAADIKELYLKFKGNMGKIMNRILCGTVDEEPRYREIIQKMIDNEEVESFKAFVNESQKKREARKKRADREAAEADKMAEELGIKSEDGLRALILKKNKEREAAQDEFFSALEAKYGGKQVARKRARREPADDEGEEDEDEVEKPKKGRKGKAATKKRT